MGESMREPRFKVPSKTIQDMSGSADAPHEARADTVTRGSFEVPEQAVRDLGRLTGDVSVAKRLLVEGYEPPEDTVPAADQPEEERVKRNFSFTDGETRHVFEKMSPKDKRKAISLRSGLVHIFGDRGVSERTIGLLLTDDTDMASLQNGRPLTQSSTYHHYYVVHLGEPMEDLPHLMMNAEGTRVESETWDSECHRLKLRHSMGREQVEDFKETVFFKNPQLLALRMGGTMEDWQNSLPDILEGEEWRKSGKSWSPWIPSVRFHRSGGSNG